MTHPIKVVIAGGHGQIALLLQRKLALAGHRPTGIIRNPDHTTALQAIGAAVLVLDLEHTTVDELSGYLHGADAVVFAAGAGAGSGAEAKLTLDRDGAILLADAAEQAGVRRYLMVSAIAADDHDPDSDDVFQVYLRAKAEADADLRGRDLDWTIVRPGSLTDAPASGRVLIAESTGPGSVTRSDVAELLFQLLVQGTGVRRQVEVISADRGIGDLVAEL